MLKEQFLREILIALFRFFLSMDLEPKAEEFEALLEIGPQDIAKGREVAAQFFMAPDIDSLAPPSTTRSSTPSS